MTKRLQIPPQARRAHLASMQGLLDAERANGIALRRAISPVLKGQLDGPGNVAAKGYQIRSAAAQSLIGAMQRGREVSRKGVAGEFAVMRQQIVAAGVNPFTLPLALPTLPNNDLVAAQQYAAELADGFVNAAARLLDQNGGHRRSAGVALPTHRIDTLAATATAEPFNDERRQIERATAAQYSGTQWLPGIVKIWEATLDVRRCDICRRMHGQIRPWGLSFSDRGTEREPAGVHRRCRCVSVNVFSVLYMGRDPVEQEAA